MGRCLDVVVSVDVDVDGDGDGDGTLAHRQSLVVIASSPRRIDKARN